MPGERARVVFWPVHKLTIRRQKSGGDFVWPKVLLSQRPEVSCGGREARPLVGVEQQRAAFVLAAEYQQPREVFKIAKRCLQLRAEAVTKPVARLPFYIPAFQES